MADKKNERPIIIKKEEIIEGGHHGGAWKVAYADFMTAMMAFFLLMWLLNITTDDQRRGIASFFNPMADKVGNSTSNQSILETSPLSAPSSIRTVRNSNEEPAPKPDGKQMHQSTKTEGKQYGGKESSGILNGAGINILPPNPTGGSDDDPSTESARTEIIPLGGPKSGAAKNIGQVGQGNSTDNGSGGSSGNGGSGADQTALENHKLNDVIKGLKDSLAKDDQLKDLDQNLGFKIGTDEIRIEMQDTARHPMFDNGSTYPNKNGKALLSQIGSWLSELPEDVSLVGTTDSVPYPAQQTPGGLSNWTLSEMRADRSRELLVRNGYSDKRIRSVEGHADRTLANPLNPEAPENRRIIIIIHRLHPLPRVMSGVDLQKSNGQLQSQ